MSEQEKEETTEVAKRPQKTTAQQRRENEEYFHDPMAMVRAVRSLSAKSQWGQNLTSEEAQAFEGVAQSNNVSLTNGTAYVLGGNLYISLQGRLKIAHATGLFGGFTVDRPMSDEERQAYRIKEDEVSWITTAIKFLVMGDNECHAIQFTDYGRASPSEKNPVAKQNPVEMAMKRARARALKLAFPCGLNSVEECIEAEVIKIEDERNTPRIMNPAEIVMEERKADIRREEAAEKSKAPTDEEVQAAMEADQKERDRTAHTSAVMHGTPEPEPTDSDYDAAQDEAFEKARQANKENYCVRDPASTGTGMCSFEKTFSHSLCRYYKTTGVESGDMCGWYCGKECQSKEAIKDAAEAAKSNPVADAGAQDILEGK